MCVRAYMCVCVCVKRVPPTLSAIVPYLLVCFVTAGVCSVVYFMVSYSDSGVCVCVCVCVCMYMCLCVLVFASQWFVHTSVFALTLLSLLTMPGEGIVDNDMML